MRSTVVIIVLLGLVGCAPSDDQIYIAGTAGSWNRPFVWHDGVRTELVDEEGDFHASADAVVVHGGDVVVAGDYKNQAVLWRNGEMEVLCDSGEADDAVTTDGALIIAGTCDGMPGVWRDGDWTEYSCPGDYCFVHDLGVDGDAIYLAGEAYTDNEPMLEYSPYYWDDGTPVEITDGLGDEIHEVTANAIAVKGGDIHVVGSYSGFEDAEAAVWVNGEHQVLDGTRARAIHVAGSALYIGGRDDEGACYWKNGNKHRLELPFGGGVDDITTSGGTVVAVGEYGNYTDEWGVYWVGGKYHELFKEGVLDVDSVFVDR